MVERVNRKKNARIDGAAGKSGRLLIENDLPVIVRGVLDGAVLGVPHENPAPLD